MSMMTSILPTFSGNLGRDVFEVDRREYNSLKERQQNLEARFNELARKRSKKNKVPKKVKVTTKANF